MSTEPTTNQDQISGTENSNNSNLLNEIVTSITNVIKGNSDEGDDDASQSVSYVPRTDFSVLILAQSMLPFWVQSGYKLSYITTDEFENMINIYELKLASGRSVKAERTPTVDRLKQLREQMVDYVSKIKDMLSLDYGRSASIAHYPAFGIVKTQKNYSFPAGYDETKRAMEDLLKALVTYGYADHKYGLAVWQPIYDEYVSLAGKNRALTGSGSAFIGDKNVLKDQIIKVLRSVLLLLQANYPETWQNIAREWGYLRERY